MTSLKSDSQKELDEQCRAIAKMLNDGDLTDSDGNEIDVSDYVADSVLDYRFIINADGSYHAVQACVAYGGPGIWINTDTKTVEGYWWGDRATAHYHQDQIHLDEYFQELWEMR